MPMNGSVCRAVTLDFASAVDPDLAAWMERDVAFPNSMVDRITPATENEHRELLRSEYGIIDEWPVIAVPLPAVGHRPRSDLSTESMVAC